MLSELTDYWINISRAYFGHQFDLIVTFYLGPDIWNTIQTEKLEIPPLEEAIGIS